MGRAPYRVPGVYAVPMDALMDSHPSAHAHNHVSSCPYRPPHGAPVVVFKDFIAVLHFPVF